MPVLVIPDNLINKNPEEWKRADIIAFLNANKDGYDLDDKHIDAIRINEVSGIGFLLLTTEKLLQSPYGLPGGPAAGINYLKEKLQGHWETIQKDRVQGEGMRSSLRRKSEPEY